MQTMWNPYTKSAKKYAEPIGSRPGAAKKFALLGAGITLVLLLSSVFSIFLLYYLNTPTLFLVAATILFLLYLLATSIVNVFQNKNKVYLILLATSIIGFCILFFQPLRYVGARIDFDMYRAEREKVVAMLADGTLSFNKKDTIRELPSEYAHLSKYDGSIMVKNENGVLTVCFFTTRGLWNVFPVFVYKSDLKTLQYYEMGRLFNHVSKEADHWYIANISNAR